MVLGFSKLLEKLKLKLNKKMFICYLGIIITQCLQISFLLCMVLNNLYIYIIGSSIFTSSDWEDFNKFFSRVYKSHFTFINLASLPIGVMCLFIFQICYALRSCIKQIGFKKTILFLKRSPSAFWISIMTCLAVYDMHLNYIKKKSIKDPALECLDSLELQTQKETKRFQLRRWSTIEETTKPNIKAKRSQSLPCFATASSCSILPQNWPQPTSKNPTLDMEQSLVLFTAHIITQMAANIIEFALAWSRNDIFVSHMLFRHILTVIYVVCFIYFIR